MFHVFLSSVPTQHCLLKIIIFMEWGFIFPNMAFKKADEDSVFNRHSEKNSLNLKYSERFGSLLRHFFLIDDYIGF